MHEILALAIRGEEKVGSREVGKCTRQFHSTEKP